MACSLGHRSSLHARMARRRGRSSHHFPNNGNFSSRCQRSGFEIGRPVMDLAPLVRAVEALMSPLDWGGRDAWLGESLRRVREACGAEGPELAADLVGELETLLRLPHDEPGWLHAALASPEPE